MRLTIALFTVLQLAALSQAFRLPLPLPLPTPAAVYIRSTPENSDAVEKIAPNDVGADGIGKPTPPYNTRNPYYSDDIVGNPSSTEAPSDSATTLSTIIASSSTSTSTSASASTTATQKSKSGSSGAINYLRVPMLVLASALVSVLL